MNYPNQCYIEITDKCNLKCIHCFASASDQNCEHMTTEDIIKIYKQIEELGVVFINISGGEPLLNPDFYSIIEVAVEQPYETCLLTNGILWDIDSIRKLAEIDKYRKLTIQISIDGDSNMMQIQRGMNDCQFQQMFENIRAFKAHGFNVTALHVANSLTIKNSVQVCKTLLEANEVDSVQIVPIFSAGRAVQNAKQLIGHWEEWERIVLEVTDIRKYNLWGDLSKSINLGFFTLFELALPLDRSDRHQDIIDIWGLNVDDQQIYKSQMKRPCFCEAGRSELAISASKQLYPCVASIRSSMKCGSLRDSSVGEIWESSKQLEWFRNGIDNIVNKEPCNSCTYKQICNGGCRLSALELIGDKFAPDPRCPIVIEYEECRVNE